MDYAVGVGRVSTDILTSHQKTGSAQLANVNIVNPN